MWDLTIHPPSGSTSLLAHRLIHHLRGSASLLVVSGFDTICNGSSPPLTNIVLFGFSLWVFPFRLSLKVFNTRLLGRGCFVLLPNRCGISQYVCMVKTICMHGKEKSSYVYFVKMEQMEQTRTFRVNRAKNQRYQVKRRKQSTKSGGQHLDTLPQHKLKDLQGWRWDAV